MEKMEMNQENQEQTLFSENAVLAGEGEQGVSDGSGAAAFGFDIVENSDGQLSLFGPGPEDAAKEADKKGKGKGSPSSGSVSKTKAGAPKTPPAPPRPKLEKVPLNEEDSWCVRYGGVTYIVNNLFEEEIALGKTEATLSEIREKLATDEACVELTEARAKWDFEKIEEKILLLDAYGTSKGCC